MENQRFAPDVDRPRPTTRRNAAGTQRLACSPHTYLRISAAGMPECHQMSQQQPKNKTKSNGQKKKQSQTAQDDSILDTPCRQIAQLNLQSNHNKNTNSSKLLSSKSLTQLMPKRLFFKKKKSWLSSSQESGALDLSINGAQMNQPPSCQTIEADLLGDEDQLEDRDSSIIDQNLRGRTPELLVNRVNSVSLVALPRQSIASSSGSNDWSLDRANLSPIILKRARDGLSSTLVQAQLANTTATPVSTIEEVDEQSQEDDLDSPSKSERSKGFRRTALVLRDVKNSIGLRLKAKHESRAFAKFTNELATPSPGAKQLHQSPVAANPNKELKAKKKLSLLGNRKFKTVDKNENDKQLDNSTTATTPKGRIALQHKKHLMHANKFAFDSPTGRLRETVKEVEQFQQCIEDISKAIKARRV